MRDARAVHRVTRLEVVGAIDDHVGGSDECCKCLAADARGDPAQLDTRIDRRKPRDRRIDLRLPDVGRRVENLALQVGEIHAIVVAQRERADAGGGEELRDWRTEPADPDDQRVRLREARLRVRPELVEQDVAAVAEELGVVHQASGIRHRVSATRALGAVY